MTEGSFPFSSPSSLLLLLPHIAGFAAPPPPSTSASSQAAASTYTYQSVAASFRILSVPGKFSLPLNLDLFLGFHVLAMFIAR